MDNRQGIVGQQHRFATRFQREIRVQEPTGVDIVTRNLIRSENKQVLAGIERRRWEGPLVELVHVVGQMPSIELHGAGRRVVQFNPVRKIAIPVRQSCIIGRHEFSDQRSYG